MIFTAQQLCGYGCGRSATHTTKNGKHICAKHHRSCPAVLDKGYKTNLVKYGSTTPAGSESVLKKMQSTTMERYGVANISSAKKTKIKKKKKALERYGVDNVSKATAVKQLIGKKASDRWNNIYKDKNFTADGLNRKEYGSRASQYADTQYRRNQTIIDPENKRGRHWHVDHIYSVTDGFLNDVPVNIISDISNLRLITDKDNYKKHKKSDKTIEQLYEDYELASSE
jgi:hypothetical protein